MREKSKYDKNNSIGSENSKDWAENEEGVLEFKEKLEDTSESIKDTSKEKDLPEIKQEKINLDELFIKDEGTPKEVLKKKLEAIENEIETTRKEIDLFQLEAAVKNVWNPKLWGGWVRMGVRSQLFGLLLKRNKEGSWESMLRNMLYYMPGLGKKFEEKLQKLRALEDIAEELKNKIKEKE